MQPVMNNDHLNQNHYTSTNFNSLSIGDIEMGRRESIGDINNSKSLFLFK